MAYQSLYRRYRPHRFSDVRGQEHATRALRNAVRDDKVTHAYMFSGPRGTGKTSTARILAKALNCENLQDGEPCGVCDSCLAIDAGNSYDVQELDAASNNGVADMKDLVSRANLGSPGRTKVYILDEVHMLTPAASAALLKTLEEPPAHVVFVLATTDPQKVLPTIRSRTQHYDFHLLSVEDLSEHVAWVIHDAGLGLPDDVIEHVVRAGAGSARDTLSALDQVAAAGGVVDREESLVDLLDAVAEGDPGKALAAVAEAVSAGRDPRILGEALLGRLRDVFLVRMGGPTPHLPPGDVDLVRSWADQLGDRATTRALEAVGDALLEMRQAPDPRIPLEVALVKMTRVDASSSADALVDRVARLEAALASGNVPTGGATPAAPAAPSSSAPAPAPSAPARPAASSGGSASASASAPATPRSDDRPAPPPRPSGGPADQARAKLAAAKAERAATTGRPTAPAKPATSPASAAPSSPGRKPAAPEAAALAEPPTEQPAATPTASQEPAPASAPAGPLDVDRFTAVWNDDVLSSLGGMTKAMYAIGRIVSVENGVAVLGFPNEVHRQKCEQKRAAVEAVLATKLDSPVRLELVVDADGHDESGGSSGGSSRGAAPEPEEDFDLGATDVHDLENAPDGPTGGLDALTDAFPGAELIDGASD